MRRRPAASAGPVVRYSAYCSVNLPCGGDRVYVYFLCWDGLFGAAVSYSLIPSIIYSCSYCVELLQSFNNTSCASAMPAVLQLPEYTHVLWCLFSSSLP